jgi:peptidoglycan/xylan/chitin deacetylase (PgdA/CDA1 family)
MLGEGLEALQPFGGIRCGSERVVAAVSGPQGELEEAARGLPAGAARDEAVAVRLRDGGVTLTWGEPVVVSSFARLLGACRERGRSSVALLGADPALLPGLQLGGWFDGSRRLRVLRRLGRWLPTRALVPLARRSPRWLAVCADLAFWAGVADRAEPPQWQRLTAASYVALVYHRFAGESKPGQERIDISPRRFARQLAVLRWAGFRPLSGEAMLAFHRGSGDLPPPRSVSITIDDGMRDCVAPLRRHADWSPQLFVPTSELGGAAYWTDGEPLASWEEIVELAAAGVAIGSHARHHQRLTELDEETAAVEMAGSLADLRQRLADPLPVLAFPNGALDERLCRLAGQLGYEAAYTTEKGRNGLGTDPFCLKRVSIHAADGALAVLWKAWTGEGLPPTWYRLRARLLRGCRFSARPSPPAK